MRRVESRVAELAFRFYDVIYGVLNDGTAAFVRRFDDYMWVILEVLKSLSLPWGEVAVFWGFVDVFVDGQSGGLAEGV